ncbi:MAG: hypothetical protein H5T86_04005, partial [Armatimonadetes bacterium]|nr:hypothetical protein [Armatimonadota bacterium]
SGTQGNLVSLMSLSQPGEEMIADELAHLLHYEGGGCVRVAGLYPRTVPCRRGCPEPEDVVAQWSTGSTTRGRTAVVVMENTHNLAGGLAVEPERMRAVAEAVWERGGAVHLDGARIFNASVALGRPVSEFAQWCDTITFCFSKSLGAPAGSIVCGSSETIQRARAFRRMLGGSMRQTGHLAAAALVALDTMVDRLADDHRHAREIAAVLARCPGVEVQAETVQTNMVYFRLVGTSVTPEDFVAKMRERGIITAPFDRTGRFRFVTHHNIGDEETARVCEALEEILGG